MNLISITNIIASFLLFISFAFTLYTIFRKRLYAISGLFLILALLPFFFSTLSNVLEHSNITSVFDQYEEYFEVVIIPFFLLFIYSVSSQNEILNRIKKEKVLTEVLNDRETIIKELHHRILNNLQLIASIIFLQVGFINDENARKQFQSIGNRVSTLGMFHKTLYQSKNLSLIDFNNFIHIIIDDIITKFDIENGKINYKIETNNIQTNVDTAIPCGLIIYEIITNSLEHAFSKAKPITVGITINDIGNNTYKLKVYDTGSGLPENVNLNNNSGMGLLLIKVLSEQLNSQLIIGRENGTSYEIIFEKVIKEEKRWEK